MKYIVSACLAGFHCKYNGGSNPCDFVIELYKKGYALPLCPETLSGLPAPREPAEIKEKGVFSKSGKNWTTHFEKGAKVALQKARASGVRKAILKSRSPSCGYGQVYDGSFTGKLRPGNGIWAQKLSENGFEIFTEESLPGDD